MSRNARGSRYLLLKLGALGDISFFLPTVDEIRRRDPGAEITWVVSRVYADLLALHPGVHRVISVDEGKLFKKSWYPRLKETWNLWRQLDFFYDQIWIGHRTLGAFLLVRLRVMGRIFQVVRRSTRWVRFFREEIIVPPLVLQEGLGFKVLTERALGRSIAQNDWRADFSWIPSFTPPFPGPYIVVHLGGGSNAKTEFRLKRWPHWPEFLEGWLRETQLPVVLVGTSAERSEADALVKEMGSSRLISLVGQTELPVLIDVLRSSQLCVGVDSGPLHWADALGVPTLGLFGPTSGVSWGLLGSLSRVIRHSVPCSPCYQDDGVFPECPFALRCMHGLRPDQVLRVARDVLEIR